MSRRVHRRRRSVITAKDLFCGAGGSTEGAKRAGVEVTDAANHWKLACRTYNKNHPNTDVRCADISNHDPRRFRRTDLLIASPECTTHSPAGGNRRIDLDPDDEAAFIRSRATMRDVPRFSEYHEYEAMAIENVVEVTRWGPNNDGSVFRHWLKEMELLGYKWRLLSLNSMFCWPTPQSRDRLYIVFWRKGNKAPDFDFYPPAPCFRCERVVASVQTWKPGAIARAIDGQPVGKYRTQYVFTCPKCRTEVTPFYYAALNAIDFSIAAERIGDRTRALKERTLERIRYGLDKYGRRQLIIRTNMTTDRGYGPGDGQRVRGLDAPHFAQTSSWLDGLFSPFLVRSQHSDGGPHARGLNEPMGTATASGLPGLVTPYFVECAYSQDERARIVGPTDPLSTQSARQSVGLVSPGFILGYANGDAPPRPLTAPLPIAHAGGNNYGFLFNVGGRDTMSPLERAAPTQETRDKLALLTPFMITERTHNKGNGIDGAAPTVCAGTIHHALIQGAAQISMRDADAMRVAGLDREMMSQGCGPQQGIMSRRPFFVSYYGNNQAAGAEEPLDTVTVRDRHAMVEPDLAVDDCYFRMLQPHEIGRAMAFPNDYQIEGNKRDQVKQFGNAVTPPAMDFIMGRIIESLGGRREA